MTTISEQLSKYSNYSDVLIPVTSLPLLDILLCSMISSKARWFQLHAVTNLIITIIIFGDVMDYYTNLFTAIVDKTSNLDNYFILCLHGYHCLFFKNLTILDYFHHFFFVFTGVIPCTFFVKSNISRFLTFTGCGLPGIIEYGSLVLMKNGVLTSLQQKKINSYMYAYLRNPLALFNMSFIFISYYYNLFYGENKYIILYIMFLTYFNGTFYSKLTIENYKDCYYKNLLGNGKA